MGVNAPVKAERNWLALDKDDYLSTQTLLRIAVVASIACALVASLCQRLVQLCSGSSSSSRALAATRPTPQVASGTRAT
jgi:hypothetical protein